MFDFTISTSANNHDFMKTCKKIEYSKKLPLLSKLPVLIDVDGSLYQKYIHGKESITVNSDYDVDCVYVQTSIDLSAIFNS